MVRIGWAIVLALGLAWPFAVDAQPSKVFRVGYLSALSGSDPEVRRGLEAFRQGRRERSSGFAAELTRLKVDVLVASGGVPVARAAQQATKVIPIVMTGPADPVADGLIASLARPGGNITGLAIVSHELVGKELELLREVVPTLSRVAVLWNPTNPGNTHQLRGAESAARTLGVRLHPVEARNPVDIEQAFAAMTKERAGALRLRLHAEAGGLMAYAASQLDTSRRVASYVDRLLKGARPADLPVELPTKFELIINMTTARALELGIPPSVLLRADQIIH